MSEAEIHLYIDGRGSRYADGWWYADPQSTVVPLRSDVLAKARCAFPIFFAGNVLAVPRSMERVYRVGVPAAFNSSFNLFSAEPDKPWAKKLLSALALYLESDALRYFAALNSRQMLIDRWVIELESTLDLAFPFTSPEDPDLVDFIHASGSDQKKILQRKLGIDPDYWANVTSPTSEICRRLPKRQAS